MSDDYASYCVVTKFPELQIAADVLETELRSEGRIAAADKVLRAYIDLRDGLIALAERMAIRGDEILVSKEHESRVRPDTLGEGGPRLEDFLRCDPLPIVPGSLGVANETLLDAHVPWWVTNEIGSSANVGRMLYGAFFGPGQAEARPSAGERQQHPLFEPRGRGEFRGSGIIEHPIPARYFVRDAVAEIDVEWRAGFQALVAAYISEVTVLP